jgi:hypothetical protein
MKNIREKLIHIGRNEVNMKKEKYEIGDIVFVSKYKYENGEDGNNHLFVIISNDNEYIPIEYFGMIVSSQIKKAKYKSNVKIIKNNENGLHQDSIVKCDYIYKFPSKNIVMKIGRVDIDDYLKFIEIYNKFLEKVNEKITEKINL